MGRLYHPTQRRANFLMKEKRRSIQFLPTNPVTILSVVVVVVVVVKRKKNVLFPPSPPPTPNVL